MQPAASGSGRELFEDAAGEPWDDSVYLERDAGRVADGAEPFERRRFVGSDESGRDLFGSDYGAGREQLYGKHNADLAGGQFELGCFVVGCGRLVNAVGDGVLNHSPREARRSQRVEKAAELEGSAAFFRDGRASSRVPVRFLPAGDGRGSRGS